MTDLQKGRPEHTTIAIQNGGSKEDSESRKHLVVLGISLDSLPRATQFLVCCGGVFLFYLIYGYVQVRNYPASGGSNSSSVASGLEKPLLEG